MKFLNLVLIIISSVFLGCSPVNTTSQLHAEIDIANITMGVELEYTLPGGPTEAEVHAKISDLTRYIEKNFSPDYVVLDPILPYNGEYYLLLKKDGKGKDGIGYLFEITKDIGVVEIKTPPLTPSELQEIKADIKDLFFKSTGEVGLIPNSTKGNGHIHIGMDSILKQFSDEYKTGIRAILNYIADHNNNGNVNELLFKSWERINANPLNHLNSSDYREYYAIIANAHASLESKSINDYADAINFLTESVMEPIKKKHWTYVFGDQVITRPPKYMSLNVLHLEDIKTLEWRSVKMYPTAEDMVLMVEFEQRRWKYILDRATANPSDMILPYGEAASTPSAEEALSRILRNIGIDQYNVEEDSVGMFILEWTNCLTIPGS